MRSRASERPSLDGPAKTVDVLVVEDDVDACAALAEALASSGLVVRSAGTANEASAAVAWAAPDVLVADLSLGGVSGSELAQALRESPRGGPIVMIAVTGVVEPSGEALRHFDAYVRKPIQVSQLLDLIEQLMEAKAGA